ncbi:MAG: LysM peptidoglycan-binding domain-containing protein, partial [Bacteroidia bacterium]|nr:LysM peptidoglycan-binding domain-containing protein [Bacteroidia bacterium]
MKWKWWRLPFLWWACWGQPESLPPQPSPETIQSFLTPDSLYPFLKISENQLFLPAYLTPFWQKVRSRTGTIRILHIGDSHIHNEVQGSAIRARLYALWGSGGRGYVFPFALAGSTGAYDYITPGAGQWLSSRATLASPSIPLGFTGISIGTYDPTATWEIRWSAEYPPTGSCVALLVRTLRPGITLTLRWNDTLPLIRDTLPAGYRLLQYTLPGKISYLKGQFSWESNDSLSYAEIQGLFLEGGAASLNWHTVGLNGLKLSQWIQLPLLRESLLLLAPDLIILDLGTNDLYGGEMSLGEFRRLWEAAIDTIRRILPETPILLTTPQDFYRKLRPISLLPQVSHLIRWIATQKKVSVWDAYTILGSMRAWRLSGLAQADHVHLTPLGYTLKGQMLLAAVLKGYMGYLQGALPNPAEESATVPALPDSLLKVSAPVIPLTPSITQFGGAPPTTYAPPRPTYLYHRVRAGETLGEIAHRYRVTVQAIRTANGLRGSFIRAGQTLRIPVLGSVSKSPAPSSTSSSHSPSSRYHVVKAGESLWSIAQRYGMSIDKLCKANGLTPRSAIYPGP